MRSPIRKALTFRASSIGDCLMGKYFLDNIHAQFPDARLGIVVAGKSAMIRDLLAAYPHIEVIEANRRSPRALLKLLREWRHSDVVCTQYAGKAGGSFGLLSKFAARALARRGGLVGFADAAKGTAFLYDHLLPFNPDVAPAQHEREALLAAGLSVPLQYPTLSATPDARVLQTFGVAAGKYIVVNLFSGSIKRGLSPERCKNLVEALAEALPQTTLLITGGPADATAAAEAGAGISNARIIAGKASLQETIQLVLQAACTVSLDTGVAHIAAQLRRPVFVISTCMGLFWWGEDQYGLGLPAGLFSRPEFCRDGHTLVDHPACMNDADFGALARRVREVLA